MAIQMTIGSRALCIRTEDCVDSTNAALRRLADAGGAEGEVLIAGRQTAGRGRSDRSFYSPEGTGIYCSVLLRPTCPPALAPRLTTAAAVAVMEGIREVYGIRTQIKWVNDLYCEGRKVCGILVESAVDSEANRLAYAVVGFGINLLPPPDGFPREIAQTAGALFASPQLLPFPSQEAARLPLIAAVLERFFYFYDHLKEGLHLPAYREASFLRGKRVTYLQGRDSLSATVVDIDPDGNLLLRKDSGELCSFGSGKISLHGNTF